MPTDTPKTAFEELLEEGHEVSTTLLQFPGAQVKRALKGDLCIVTVTGIYTRALGKELERLCLSCTTNLGLEFAEIQVNPETQKRFDATIVGLLKTIRDAFAAKRKQLLLCMPPSELVDMLKLTGVYSGYRIIENTAAQILSTGPSTVSTSATPTQKPFKGTASPSIVTRKLLTLNQSLKRTASLEKGLESAEKCIRHFLPQNPPTHAGWSFAFSSKSSERVGGDFLDFIPVDERTLGILIGDVSGHGLDAAILMGITKKVISMRAKETASEGPRATLLKAHADISTDFTKYSFVTILYATLDLLTGTLSIAKAGHEPPILFYPGTAPATLSPKGIPIGPTSAKLFAATLGEETLNVPRGASVLFSTDGLAECWSPRGEQFGRQRLSFTLSTVPPHLTCQQTLEYVLSTISQFASGRPPEDDMTAILIKRL